ncbi:exocyst complex component 3-like protein 4 [Striga asiatica]|uniref:Exocyst complex component 3-like protein 4 n=1 Tax=Striga asiatica TaxID=4170 RepID=A0A5A7QGA3_STRAF|nr:exocyst complex component 3-like protein 4 [Striga asiatica]
MSITEESFPNRLCHPQHHSHRNSRSLEQSPAAPSVPHSSPVTLNSIEHTEFHGETKHNLISGGPDLTRRHRPRPPLRPPHVARATDRPTTSFLVPVEADIPAANIDHVIHGRFHLLTCSVDQRLNAGYDRLRSLQSIDVQSLIDVRSFQLKFESADGINLEV